MHSSCVYVSWLIACMHTIALGELAVLYFDAVVETVYSIIII